MESSEVAAVNREHDQVFAGLYTKTLLTLVAERGGSRLVAETLERAGEERSADELQLDSTWSSYWQLRRLAEAAADLLGGAKQLGPSDGAIGSMVTTDGVLAMGSPNTIMEAAAGCEVSPICQIVRSDYSQLAETSWRLVSRFDAGFEAFPEHCQLVMRMMSWLPRAFGCKEISIGELSCACDGAPECVIELSWESEDHLDSSEIVLTNRIQNLEERLSGLQETVRGIVSDSDFETAMERVVRSASAAVGVPGFVLVLDDVGLTGRSLFSCGLSEESASQAADRLRRQGSSGWPLAADIRTPSRSYGWLAAIDHSPGMFIQQEEALLESYARLAATALDVAVSLESSRRDASVARSLLHLARSLAVVTSTEELAQRLAESVLEIIDCDRTVVTLADPHSGKLKIAATVGYEPELDSQLRLIEFTVDDIGDSDSDVNLNVRDEENQRLRAVMDLTGTQGRASVPIIVGDQRVGSVVATVIDRPERLASCPELTERLSGLAAQAAIALRNARLVDQLREQALYDPLTKLPNRHLLEERAHEGLETAAKMGDQFALLFVDLDRFKVVNDSLGHDVGDSLIRQAASRLREVVPEGGTLSRIGGDEFMVALPGLSQSEEAETVADAMIDRLRTPFDLANQMVYVTASIGIALYPDDGKDYGQLMQAADSAMYAAKAAGRCRHVRQNDPRLAEERTARLSLESELHRAVEGDELTVLYQPQVALDGLMTTGVEALVRWKHPSRGLLAPAEFLPVAEDCGLMPHIDRQVRQLAFGQAKRWCDAIGPLLVAVNLSRQSLMRPGIVDEIKADLETARVDPRLIEIEITETAVTEDCLIPAVDGLASLGLRVAVDDFGTGAAALQRLRRLQVHTLKIDRSLTVCDSAEDAYILGAIVQLGNNLGLRVVAEGVEEPSQANQLRRLGCGIAQGFLFGRPMDLQGIDGSLRRSESYRYSLHQPLQGNPKGGGSSGSAHSRIAFAESPVPR